MNWSSATEFLAMGGYGLYVWGAFGVTALVMVGEMWSLRARRKALRHAEPAAVEPDHHVGWREGTA